MRTPFNAWTPVTDEEASAYAYALWEADGRPHGRDQYYWYQAKALLTLSRREEATAQQAKTESVKSQAPRITGKITRQNAGTAKSSAPKKAKKRELETVGG